MPNTRADLERLKHHWEEDDVVDPEVVDELLAMAERLVTGLEAAIAGAHVIREDLDGDMMRLSRVIHASRLGFLLNPEGSNDEPT